MNWQECGRKRACPCDVTPEGTEDNQGDSSPRSSGDGAVCPHAHAKSRHHYARRRGSSVGKATGRLGPIQLSCLMWSAGSPHPHPTLVVKRRERGTSADSVGISVTVRKAAGSVPDYHGAHQLDCSLQLPHCGPGSTLSLSLLEMSTRNLRKGKGRPARKANSVTAICDATV